MKIEDRVIELVRFPEPDEPLWLIWSGHDTMKTTQKLSPQWTDWASTKLCYVEYPTHYAYYYQDKWGEQ